MSIIQIITALGVIYAILALFLARALYVYRRTD